jgi:hypothetical protein
MLVVHGTKKFLDRAGRPDLADDRPSTTALGGWYANIWFWRPQVALFVNETTLFPVLVPMAPASSVVSRFVTAAGEAFAEYGLDPAFVHAELAEMREFRLAKTESRSVVGIMNEFGQLAEHHRAAGREVVLHDLAVWLARTPCSPLYATHTSPDRALRAAATGQR